MASCWQQRQVSPCLRLSSTTEWLSFQLFFQIQFIDRVLRAGCTTETGFTVQTVQKTAEIPQVRAQIGVLVGTAMAVKAFFARFLLHFFGVLLTELSLAFREFFFSPRRLKAVSCRGSRGAGVPGSSLPGVRRLL